LFLTSETFRSHVQQEPIDRDTARQLRFGKQNSCTAWLAPINPMRAAVLPLTTLMTVNARCPP
jgi:hypothetical protein